MPLRTTAQSPVPVRVVLRLVGEWIGRLGRVWVEGQIAELSRRGGTAFLTLRDPVAAVSARVICPRTVLEAASPPPAVGSRVVVWARPDFSTARGSFSLAAVEIRAVGTGELLVRLERLRQALAAEGLFAAARKRPLPFLPGVVGLVCGRDSAAQRDVQRQAAARWPAVRFRVEQVAVQGPSAAAEVTAAVQRLDADPSVDVIVIARGGGAVEDLLPFSDETLLRAVAACRTPVVSAIGHEQDSPLLDLVADVRASTPTDAARLVVPDMAEQRALISQLRARGWRIVADRVDRERSWLAGLRSRPVLANPLREIDRRAEQVSALTERGRRHLASELARAAGETGHLRARLLALSPAATLRRGYAIVQRLNGAVVRGAAEVAAGERLAVRFADGVLPVTAGAAPAPQRADAARAGSG
jgi:exodeoxyribonuclease VII large subunit